jgi:hypothetical protein
MPKAECRGCTHEAIKVTVSDPETGEVLGEQIVKDDYLLICAGRRYLKSTQVMGKTHMLAVGWDPALIDGQADG